MKNIIFVAALALSAATGVAQAEQVALGPFETDLKLIELVSLPQGLTVTHTPESVTDRVDGPTGAKWTHSTTISSTVGPVTIVEFGCFRKERGQWTIATVNKMPYSADNFAKWYNCPNAELQPNQSYTDEANLKMPVDTGC